MLTPCEKRGKPFWVHISGGAGSSSRGRPHPEAFCSHIMTEAAHLVMREGLAALLGLLLQMQKPRWLARPAPELVAMCPLHLESPAALPENLKLGWSLEE